MIITPTVPPPRNYAAHPGTFLRRTWSSWYLSRRPYRQPIGTTDPATERFWFGTYSRSYGRGIMSDGRHPDNQMPISNSAWNLGNSAWNSVGGFTGRVWLDGQNFYQHLNVIAALHGTRNYAAPPYYGLLAASVYGGGFTLLIFGMNPVASAGQVCALTYPGNVPLIYNFSPGPGQVLVFHTLVPGDEVYESGSVPSTFPGIPFVPATPDPVVVT